MKHDESRLYTMTHVELRQALYALARLRGKAARRRWARALAIARERGAV